MLNWGAKYNFTKIYILHGNGIDKVPKVCYTKARQVEWTERVS